MKHLKSAAIRPSKGHKVAHKVGHKVAHRVGHNEVCAGGRTAWQLRPCLLAAALWGSVAPALADNAAIENCRRIDDASRRLACYDAIKVAVSSSTPASKATAPVAATAAATAAATFNAAAAATPARDTTASFGLPQTANPQAVDVIESTVGPMFDGWRPRDRIKLGNGQVWEVVDEVSGTIEPKPIIKVRIKRGLFGGYRMEFEGSNRWASVRRLQ
jgi:hypothetical protein